MKIAILVSGRGSNMEAILEAALDPEYPAEVALVLSNVADAPALAKAAAAGITTATLDHKSFDDRVSFDAEVTKVIKSHKCELVVLAGFMRLLSNEFCSQWQDQLINIHPSLLPAFKGLNVHSRMIDAGVRFGGCTVHFVRAEMDAGPIIAQTAVPIHSNDDAETLAARILVEEHRLYPMVVRWIAEGRVRVGGGTVRVKGAVSPSMSLQNFQST